MSYILFLNIVVWLVIEESKRALLIIKLGMIVTIVETYYYISNQWHVII